MPQNLGYRLSADIDAYSHRNFDSDSNVYSDPDGNFDPDFDSHWYFWADSDEYTATNEYASAGNSGTANEYASAVGAGADCDSDRSPTGFA